MNPKGDLYRPVYLPLTTLDLNLGGLNPRPLGFLLSATLHLFLPELERAANRPRSLRAAAGSPSCASALAPHGAPAARPTVGCSSAAALPCSLPSSGPDVPPGRERR